jgi:two-component system sensor histidine kinase UhpB
MDQQTELVMYRIIQEALTNVARHARADEVRIRVTADAAGVRLEISDNGQGFDTDIPVKGFGLLGIRERARQLDGTARIVSAPGQGTHVIVTIPMEVK